MEVKKDIRECKKKWLAKCHKRIEKFCREGKHEHVKIATSLMKKYFAKFTGGWIHQSNGEFDKGHARSCIVYDGHVVFVTR